MCFLRILRFVLIAARCIRHVILAVILADHRPDAGNGFWRHVDAVGTHISNETDRFAADVDALIQTLRDPHGVRWRKAELAARLLLKRRGGEGRRRVAPRRLGLNGSNLEGSCFKGLLEVLGFLAGANIKTLDFLAVGTNEARIEGIVARRRQRCDE